MDGTANADTLVQVMADVAQNVTSASVGFAGVIALLLQGPVPLEFLKVALMPLLGEMPLL